MNPQACAFCEYFDGGGAARVAHAVKADEVLAGDCLNLLSPRFQTTSHDTCRMFCASVGTLGTRDGVELCREFTKRWPDAEWGPAHIVLSDYNLSDGHIEWCVALCRAALTHDARHLLEPGDLSMMQKLDWYESHRREELQATLDFLECILLPIPEDERDLDDDDEGG